MTVATDLQNVLADLSVAIAENRALGRVDLEKLRRSVSAIANEARADQRRLAEGRRSVLNLVDAIDAAIIDLPGLSRRTRERLDALPVEAN